MCPLPSPIPLWFYHTPACCAVRRWAGSRSPQRIFILVVPFSVQLVCLRILATPHSHHRPVECRPVASPAGYLTCRKGGLAAWMPHIMLVGASIPLGLDSSHALKPCGNPLLFLRKLGLCSWLPSLGVGDISRGSVSDASVGKPRLRR